MASSTGAASPARSTWATVTAAAGDCSMASWSWTRAMSRSGAETHGGGGSVSHVRSTSKPPAAPERPRRGRPTPMTTHGKRGTRARADARSGASLRSTISAGRSARGPRSSTASTVTLVDMADTVDGRARHPALEWAASGGMHLTGLPTSAPLAPCAAVLAPARATAAEIGVRTGAWGRAVAVDVPSVLFARAASGGLQRAGRTSAGGTCRLPEARDGWVAINLSRQDDVDCVPALLGRDVGVDPWNELAVAARVTAASAIVDSAQLLGMPAAVLGDAGNNVKATLERIGQAASPHKRPLVVDLSAMWVGPLCARLLGDAGARVVKVESRDRPDGARAGDVAFYDWLHAGHESVALDFADPSDLRGLHALLGAADVIVEASRPRALRQLGIDAQSVVRNRAGVTWVSITGYGQTGA